MGQDLYLKTMFCFEMGVSCVAQIGQKLLGSSDLLASTSQVAGAMGMHHYN